MNRKRVTSIVSLVTLGFTAVACGGGKAAPGKAGPGMTATGGTTGMMKPGGPMASGTGTGGAITVGIPTSGSLSTIYPGGGVTGSTPLMPGCTPASAKECPSSTGTCKTSSSSNPKNTDTGYICYYPAASTSSSGMPMMGPGMTTTTTTTTTTTVTTTPEATVEYIHETAGGQEYYHFRITFDPTFVDNTYGTNAIGWGSRGHTFNDLVGSDHAQLSLFDGSPTLVSQFNLDYISADSSASCAYSCLGISGGEGSMLVGDSKYILAATTSLDRDLNGCGYCKSAACNGDCTVDSPATDSKYTPNSGTPDWDYRVVYEVWVSAAVFASKGFGGASITFVHASPSKASSNTVTVEPKPCGSCPDGYTNYLTSEGAVCVPIPKTDGGSGGPCPQGYTEYLTSEGQVCLPTGGAGGSSGSGSGGSSGTGGGGGSSSGSCPSGYVSYLTSEGASCIPIAKPPSGGGGGCASGLVSYKTTTGSASCVPVPSSSGKCGSGQTLYDLESEGAICVPTPSDGSCPEGFALAQSALGAICI